MLTPLKPIDEAARLAALHSMQVLDTPAEALFDRLTRLELRYNGLEGAAVRTLIEAPYLPLVVQEAAGLPLDSSFAEQKKIMQRCHGLFYRCANGTEARRFNRLLIDAGLIKGM